MAFKRKSPQPINEGGTNTKAFTNLFGVSYFDGGKLNNVDVGLSGYVLTSNGLAAPSFQVAGSGGGSITWVDQTSSPVSTLINHGYIMDAGATNIVATLPTTAVLGSLIYIVGTGSGLWQLQQNAGQTINFGAISTTTGIGGSLSSTSPFDCITLVCSQADLKFVVISSIGNISYL